MELLSDFADWAWARHHNALSWYIRPLIIIAFAMAAWNKKLLLTIGLGLFFPISAIVFPAPEHPKPFITNFLAEERAWIEALSLWNGIAFVCLVVAFLWLLAASLWKRSFWLGILVANLGGAAKLVFSLFSWGEPGMTVIIPTLFTALVINGAALAFWHYRLKDKS